MTLDIPVVPQNVLRPWLWSFRIKQRYRSMWHDYQKDADANLTGSTTLPQPRRSPFPPHFHHVHAVRYRSGSDYYGTTVLLLILP